MRNPCRGWRAGLFRLLRVFAPEGSNLDAVFGSYDDWKKFRPKGLDSKAESIAATKPK
jgi:hypothetical protein